jgi:hypothetical protein
MRESAQSIGIFATAQLSEELLHGIHERPSADCGVASEFQRAPPRPASPGAGHPGK